MHTPTDPWATKADFTLNPRLEVFDKIIVDKSTPLLDFGCCTGRIIARLANEHKFLDIVGYDISHTAIANGKKENVGIADKLHHFESGHLPVANDTFGGVICCGVMACITDDNSRRLAMNDMTRTLKRGGILCMSEFLRSRSYDYDANGVCQTSRGPMKHFIGEELLSLTQAFTPLYIESKAIRSLSGKACIGYHFIGQKI